MWIVGIYSVASGTCLLLYYIITIEDTTSSLSGRHPLICSISVPSPPGGQTMHVLLWSWALHWLWWLTHQCIGYPSLAIRGLVASVKEVATGKTMPGSGNHCSISMFFAKKLESGKLSTQKGYIITGCKEININSKGKSWIWVPMKRQ